MQDLDFPADFSGHRHLTLEEVSQIVRFSPRTIARHVRGEKISKNLQGFPEPVVRGRGCRLLWHAGAVRRWLDARAGLAGGDEPPPPPPPAPRGPGRPRKNAPAGTLPPQLAQRLTPAERQAAERLLSQSQLDPALAEGVAAELLARLRAGQVRSVLPYLAGLVRAARSGGFVPVAAAAAAAREEREQRRPQPPQPPASHQPGAAGGAAEALAAIAALTRRLPDPKGGVA